MRPKPTEEHGRLTCRLPARILEWLDTIDPGNRTYAVRKVLEEAYERCSPGNAGDATASEPLDNPGRSRKRVGTVRSQ